jgi:hypothetical protein
MQVATTVPFAAVVELRLNQVFRPARTNAGLGLRSFERMGSSPSGPAGLSAVYAGDATVMLARSTI